MTTEKKTFSLPSIDAFVLLTVFVFSVYFVCSPVNIIVDVVGDVAIHLSFVAFRIFPLGYEYVSNKIFIP